MNLTRINSLIDRLDGSGSDEEWTAAKELRATLGESLPSYLLARFPTSKKWGSRSSMVYHSTKYARDSDAAIELALLALKDKSKAVRYRACMLLAYSQKQSLLPELRRLVEMVPEISRADVLAAIDAIESQNQDYFVDRSHSGGITLNIL